MKIWIYCPSGVGGMGGALYAAPLLRSGARRAEPSPGIFAFLDTPPLPPTPAKTSLLVCFQHVHDLDLESSHAGAPFWGSLLVFPRKHTYFHGFRSSIRARKISAIPAPRPHSGTKIAPTSSQNSRGWPQDHAG